MMILPTWASLVWVPGKIWGESGRVMLTKSPSECRLVYTPLVPSPIFHIRRQVWEGSLNTGGPERVKKYKWQNKTKMFIVTGRQYWPLMNNWKYPHPNTGFLTLQEFKLYSRCFIGNTLDPPEYTVRNASGFNKPAIYQQSVCNYSTTCHETWAN